MIACPIEGVACKGHVLMRVHLRLPMADLKGVLRGGMMTYSVDCVCPRAATPS